MTSPIWRDNPERCQRCGFADSQGHRSTFNDAPTGCSDSGPLGLFLARQQRDEGMSRTVAAHPSAVDLVDAAIMRRVRAGRPFSANLIREELSSLAPSERPVIGARMNALARKHCVKVGEEPSTEPATHGKGLSIWVAKSALQAVAA